MQNFNNYASNDDSKQIPLRKLVKESTYLRGNITTDETGSKRRDCMLEIQSKGTKELDSQFEDGAHIRQIIGFLPKIEQSANTGDSQQKDVPNLKVISRGIQAFVKLNILPPQKDTAK